MNILEIISKLRINLSDKIFFTDVDKEADEYYINQGYKNFIYYIDISEEDLVLLNELEKFNLPFHIKPFDNKKGQRLSHQLSIGKLFITNYFKVHDVLFLKNNKLKNGSPFSISVETLDEELLCGFLQKQDIVKDDNELKALFINIILSNKISPFTPIIYSHEITHSQLCSIKGSIENLYNDEVLSIFMELLYGYYCGDEFINNSIIISRTNDIIGYYKNIIQYNGNNKIMDDNLYENSVFYVSIITAVKLFTLYKKGSNNLKKEILANIQKVFDEKRTLEETLNIYELDWSKNSISEIPHQLHL